jgi:hypothetical protein
MALIETIPVKEDYRRKLAQQLMREGMSAEPVLHWAQGLGRMGQAALGGYEMYQADQKDKETESGNNAALIAALGGGGMPSGQPTPQQPTAQPMPPVSSVTPSAGAIPAALMGERPGGPVMPSAKVWGDKEAEAAGLYEPSTPTKTAALSPMVPTPVRTEAIQPTAAPAAPAAPTPTDPQVQASKLRIAQMLQSDNPQMRKVGQGMAQTLIANQLQGDKPTDEVREFQYAEKNPAFKQYKMDLKKAGSTNVTTTVGGGSDKQIFDAMDEGAKAARATAAGLAGLREAKQAIEGGAITGFRADDRLALQKAASFFGADPTKVANTETFKAAIAPQVAAVLKSTVGTANISNTDREFAEKAAGGNINLDEKSISRLLDIMERASVGQLQAHQKRLDKVYSDPDKFGRERALFGVEMPAMPVRPPQAAPKVNLKQKYGLD